MAVRPTPPAITPSRRQAVALLATLVVVASAVAVASVVVKPSRARAFDLFHGSVFLADERAPVAVDLASGKPTIRLRGAAQQVSAKSSTDLDVVPLDNGTLLLNRATGEFNLLDASGLAVKDQGGGVPLPRDARGDAATGIASGENAYIVRTGSDGTSVYLVGQTTVAAAATPGAKPVPRASATMDEPGSTAVGAQAAADDDLWLLVGSGPTRTIRRLSVPTGSDAGVDLHSDDVGTVSAPAAVGVATLAADGTGSDVVGVASADQIQLFRQGSRFATVHITGLAGVDRILPASQQSGRLAFLFHTAAGWNLASVRTDGTARTGPVALVALDSDAALAQPAMSNGRLYTMDLGSGGLLWQIAPNGAVNPVDGASTYPIATTADGRDQELASFTDAYVIARGSRVIYDSPYHVKALTVFTDGSHDPLTIDKKAAIDVNAAGGAASLSKSTNARGSQRPQHETKPVQQPAEPINNKINCKTSKQIPHVPTITQLTPGSRSVQLLWTYPLLDPQDCVPSTYGVGVKVLSAEAPPAPGTLTVQGQNGVTIGHLFPSTHYQVRVIAYLGGNGTPSEPMDVTTGPEGPAAPTNLHTSVDDNGNWTVTWNSCGGVQQGCVPSWSWNIVPSFCDGAGLASPPPMQSVPGDPTQHTFSAVYPGNDATLGRGLTFQVLGIGTQGSVGNPAGDGACSYSWSRPITTAIGLSASAPPPTSSDTSTTTVSVHYVGSPVRAVGGEGATLTYRLYSNGSLVEEQQPVPYTKTTATFTGIRPGQRYQVAALVTPPRHREASVPLPPVDVEPAVATWPQLSVTASFVNSGALDGTLIVYIGGVTSASSRGERFDLVNSTLDCGRGNSSWPLEQTDFDPAQALKWPHIQRLLAHGPCTVTVQLAQNPSVTTDPPYYGAGPSAAVTSAPVTIDVPSLSVSANDFDATWPDPGTPGPALVAVTYDNVDPFLTRTATDWSLVLSDDGGATTCGSQNDSPDAFIRADKACLSSAGAATAKWTVTISFTYFGQQRSFTVNVRGTVPVPTTPTPTPTPTATPSPTPT